ncbi:LysR family transcriptional regulator [Frankia sp. CNm7]|uniref:LysR family transcriptional regulator n=1 Tax=Frankia nepalensis TaxID=1836974 RepID=A0A937RUP5_9ACTN|nr:LysR family transcriptional regulator [Frankia nepalensis]MBL7502560.1 LysR family transcriptional regulator [Frankia nepalensis]MBL7516341.1 LysR family transcriptional regulator [Frankia nepalensis]MBL7519735.1 LysR family transcriptional regulator [Frankia nepalensis]MBL7633158.1 LysR family transcriptional regulator [Frankia nepalensis]
MVGVLDIVALRSLTSIADCGGFRRAADSLHLSQSAVSQHVRRLEQVCGRRLVERRGNAVRFTPGGALLLAEARKILAAHDDALDRLRTADAAERDLVIGSTEHAADLLLPSITARLRTCFPDRAVRFRIDRGKQLNDRLDEGALDASLFIGDVRGGDAHPAGMLPLAWYAAAGWRPPPGPIPLVVIDEPCTIRRRALQALGQSRVDASVVCEAGHLAGVLHAARAGLGVALLAHLGTPPEGLEARRDLPPVDPEPLHVRGRRGAPAALVGAVAEAASTLLSRPRPAPRPGG